GVFIGCSSADWVAKQSAFGGPFAATGASDAMISNRLSFVLDLKGPSQTINTASSSSLVAIHSAVRSLQVGDCSMALVGGVNMMTTDASTGAMSQLGVLSPDGKCKVFSEDADGYVRSEGCGAVVLKILDGALADKDAVLAVVRGSSVSHGSGVTLTAPDSMAQACVILNAMKEAGIEPAEVGYVEAHGTGTPLGDVTEIQALKSTYGRKDMRSWPLVVGSVKSNIGHMEGAAAMASLIKTIIVLHQRAAPPNLHLKTLNPELKLGGYPIIIPHQGGMTPIFGTCAGVSSFGFGGANAHIILDSGPELEPESESESESESEQRHTRSRSRFTFIPTTESSLFRHRRSFPWPSGDRDVRPKKNGEWLR
ncbi:unnamed protein product, partial [Chrysoparadoxa australica]